MKKIIILSSILFFALSAWGQRGLYFEYQGLYYMINSEDNATVSLIANPDVCNGNYSGSIIVPREVSYDGQEYVVKNWK